MHPNALTTATSPDEGELHPRLARLDALATDLSGRGDVLAVLGLGSAGTELDRFDDHSDLDFFVVVKDERAKAHYAADLSWLAAAGPVAYQFANEPHGRKVMFDDGLLAEYAIFTVADLDEVPFVGARVVWQHPDAPADLAKRGRQLVGPAQDTVAFHLGEAVTNLFVGMHRELRGERLTATRFVQGFAVDRMLDLLRLTTTVQTAPPDRPGQLRFSRDPFDLSRRVERLYAPDELPLARLLPGYASNADGAAVALDWLRGRFDVDPVIARAIEELVARARYAPGAVDTDSGEVSCVPTALVEVGGSRVRTAWAGPQGPYGRTQRTLVASLGDRSLSTVLDEVASSTLGLGPPERAVVAWPGPLSPDGRALASPTVAGGVTALNVGSELSRRWDGASVHVVNDLTAAGARLTACGARDFAVVTVGSGVGHKIFHEGEPLVGPAGRGGELGHLLVDRSAEAPVCSCGRRGHLGGMASGRGVVTAVVEAWGRVGRPVPPLDDAGPRVVAAYTARDVTATDVIHNRARLLGWGLAALHAATGTENFVLIGGFALAVGERYRRAVAEGAKDATWDLGLDWNDAVRLGEDDDDHGVVGAWHIARALGWVA